eukprot:7336116-Pyramimonas_sp.AAC.1
MRELGVAASSGRVIWLARKASSIMGGPGQRAAGNPGADCAGGKRQAPARARGARAQRWGKRAARRSELANVKLTNKSHESRLAVASAVPALVWCGGQR